MLATNAFICMHLCLQWIELVLAVQLGVSWLVGPVGTVGQGGSVFGWLKGYKLD
jgi:hypothetical protein